MEHRINSLITPIEGSALQKAMMDTIMAKNSRDPELLWECLDTLYVVHLGLKKGAKELENKIAPLIEGLTKIQIEGNDRAATQRKASNIILEYKKRNNGAIFRIIMISLRDNDYAETALGAIPLNLDKPHMGIKGAKPE